MTDVTVVIPTFNGGTRLEQLLAALERDAHRLRVIAVDSGSADGTLELLRRRGAEIVPLSPGTFNHGTSRNEGLARATTEFAVVMVQDAVPASDGWLDALLAPLRADPAVAGSFARQQPWPDATALTAHYLSMWVATSASPRIVGPLTRERFDAMTPAERHHACAFDNVCSCVRLSAWREHPFRATSIAEDLEWAREVLLSGYKLAYAPAALVSHSHDRSSSYELQRTYLVHQRLQALFGLSTIPTVGSLIRAVATTLPVHVRMSARERRGRARALARGAALAVAMPLGQYLGARAAREGRDLLRTRGV
ncbi:MAG TPA: glycosyltransferase [Vicinamibacterales bacterium]